LKFGIFLPTYARASFPDSIRIAVLAEKVGFDSVWAADHMINPDYQVAGLGGEPGRPETLEPFVVLSYVAALTKNVRLGTLVTPIPRSQTPMHLAKTVATLDIASNGRSILGAGVGWYKQEFLTYGFGWQSFDIRYEIMMEGVQVIKKLWTKERTDFEGKHYHLSNAVLMPKPVQRPAPPIWFGGYSERIVKATASLGDGWIPWALTPESYRQRLALLKRLCKESGRQETEIKPALSTLAHIGSDYDSVRRKVNGNLRIWALGEAKVDFRGITRLKEMEDASILGGPEDCIGQIEKLVQAGVEYIVLGAVPIDHTYDFVKSFGEKVVPHFVQHNRT